LSLPSGFRQSPKRNAVGSPTGILRCGLPVRQRAWLAACYCDESEVVTVTGIKINNYRAVARPEAVVAVLANMSEEERRLLEWAGEQRNCNPIDLLSERIAINAVRHDHFELIDLVCGTA